MWPTVAQAFPGITAKFEGYVPFMYADIKGLVTTGAGNLIDSPDAALALPWQRPDGSRASSSEVTSAWHAVKNRTDLNSHGGWAYKDVTDLRLSDEAIDQLVSEKLASNDYTIRQQFSNYPYWPADAQLAINLLAWARGPGNFHGSFPRFSQALDEGNYAGAAPESQLNAVGNAGLVPRNDMMYALFTNASRVMNEGRPLDQFYDPDLVANASAPHHSGNVSAYAGSVKKNPSAIVIALALLSVGGASYYAFSNWKKLSKPLKVIYGAGIARGAYEIHSLLGG